MLTRFKIILTTLIAVFLTVSCSETSTNSSSLESAPTTLTKPNADGALIESEFRNLDLNSISDFNEINAKLAQDGLPIRLSYAETVTGIGGPTSQGGQTIFANDRTKRLTAQWVPSDSRRPGSTNNLSYIVFDPFADANFGSPQQVDGTPAIDASFETWNDLKANSKVMVQKLPSTNANPSAILGGNPFLADISQVGFLPGSIFDAVLGPGARSSVLGVAFTFIWIDPATGEPTDVNNDGYDDIALKEVWYNDAFDWTDTGDSSQGIDIETVALHENGHALGFGHFGKVSVTGNKPGNLKLHVSPRAVMNAVILGTQRDLLGTDKASYNSIYGDWPSN
ncbi:MAG TPA: matrixin family metalloprotease [Bacteroidales bacterium]|nr:matrixin family metalloprotease [Bacteroidales bacterium]